MVNKSLIRPYFLGGVALGGGVARIPLIGGGFKDFLFSPLLGEMITFN